MTATALRLRILQGVLLLLLFVVAMRVTGMQWLAPVIPPEYGDGLAPRTLQVEPSRGLIVDRDGEVLARNVPEFRVLLVPGDLPRDVEERRRALLALEQASGIAFGTLESAASTQLAIVDPYAPVLVEDGLEPEAAIQLRARLSGLPGLRVEASPSRLYLDEPTLAHILGYVGKLPADEAEMLTALGYPLDGQVGLGGVEAIYEDDLRGLPGRRLVLSDPQGREVELLATDAAQPGSDAVLSIDLDLQRATAEALTKGMDVGMAVIRTDTGQERAEPIALGAALVMDVKTGELLASVSLPSYDANLFTRGDDEEIAAVFADRANPLIDRTYMAQRSPGSVFKPLVALAALEEGIATEHTVVYSRGAITIQDQYNPGTYYVFRDWMPHGNVDMRRALARSSDEYFYYMVGGYEDFEGMGADILARWTRAAGFGARTGIDRPGEITGLVPDSEWKEAEFGEPWLLGDSYPYSIGQGYLTVTPLQMAVFTSAIANGGDLLQPRVVHGFRSGGIVKALPSQTTGHLEASLAHYQIVREGLRDAAAPSGTAYTGVPEGISIAGKTGTTEFGQPYPDGEFDTHGWYIGYAPYDDPEVAVVVYLEYGVGSTHAGPVAKEILEAYFAQQSAGERVGSRP